MSRMLLSPGRYVQGAGAIREIGLQARLAVERNVVTLAVESIVEANTLLSGLSSENGGHAGAHSIHNGLTTLKAAILTAGALGTRYKQVHQR